MIIVKLMGGLGNQMFQYALGRNLALKNDTKLVFDTSFFRQTLDSIDQRIFELGCFGMENMGASPADLFPIKMERAFKKLHLKPFLFKPYRKLSDSDLTFDPSIFASGDRVYLEGFWQSEKYFKEIQDVIRKDFVFKEDIPSKYNDILSRIDSTASVSIHIRRGDYVFNPVVNRVLSPCSEEYYRRSVEHIEASLTDANYFVFSDDIEWAKTSGMFKGRVEFIGSAGERPSVDLQLMMRCKHNIIANSSYSWWAAWLNKNTEKIVIAPRKWFNLSEAASEDVVPSGWIRI